MSHPARIRLSIPAAGADSPALSDVLSKGNTRSTLGNSESITIFPPAALTGAVTVEVSPEYGSGRWFTLQQDGADVVVAVGKAAVINEVAFEDLRLHSAAAGPGFEAAVRDFDVVCQIQMV